MDQAMDELSDAVLYRNLYTNILSQQIHAENRLHHLMMTRQGLDRTFDEHLAKVRAKVEKDRIRIQKFGECLVLMERKDTETVFKTERKASPRSGNATITKERKQSGFSTLLNMESLRDQFRLGQNISLNEARDQINNNTQRPDSVTNNIAQTTIDPKEIEVFFENSVSQKTPNTTPNKTSNNLSTKPTDKQGHSRKFENLRNYPWPASQGLKDVLPKRVSFNDIPDVIATQEIGNERLLANQEAGWKSDYSEDEAEETSEQNPFSKQSVERYPEPPPDFNLYSYQDSNRRNMSETTPKIPEQGRIYNQSLNRKAERLRQGKSSKPFPKSPGPPKNCEESWNLGSDQGNSPFRSPWEGVISTSLQRERNDSTQVVPSSTTNNEVFLDDLLTSKTVENNQTSVKTAPNIFENKHKSSDNTTTTANLFKMDTKEHKKFEDWLNLHKNHDSKQDINEDNEIYEHVVKNERDPNFIKDDALTAMRRQSWSIHPPAKNRKQQKTGGRLASVFRRPTKNTRAPQLIKADKKEFHVTKKVRRRMSLRPLPDTPDVVEENVHALRFNTADSLDTFHDN